MAACYAPDARFSDPVFPDLRGERVGLMWRMLCERGADLRIEWELMDASDEHAKVRWEARYTFPATGRAVYNEVLARIEMEGDAIQRHRDWFDFHAWAGQALGWKGRLLGWAPPVRNAVRREAARALAAFERRR